MGFWYVYRRQTESDTEAFVVSMDSIHVVRHLSMMKLIVLYVEKLPNYLNVFSSAG